MWLESFVLPLCRCRDWQWSWQNATLLLRDRRNFLWLAVLFLGSPLERFFQFLNSSRPLRVCECRFGVLENFCLHFLNFPSPFHFLHYPRPISNLETISLLPLLWTTQLERNFPACLKLVSRDFAIFLNSKVRNRRFNLDLTWEWLTRGWLSKGTHWRTNRDLNLVFKVWCCFPSCYGIHLAYKVE